jgi:hypothetical protein
METHPPILFLLGLWVITGAINYFWTKHIQLTHSYWSEDADEFIHRPIPPENGMLQGRFIAAMLGPIGLLANLLMVIDQH